MADEREHIGWRGWLSLYADIFEVGAGVGAVLIFLLWAAGALPTPVALLIGGVCIGVLLVFMIGQLFVSNSRPIESIGAHLPTGPGALGERPRRPSQADFEKLEGRIKELEGELEEETKKYRDELRQKEELRTHRDNLEYRWKAHVFQYRWLFALVEAQAKDIGSYVVVEQLRFCYQKLDAPVPHLIFGVDVRNKSVFDITIEDEVKGDIKLAGESLLGEKQLINNPKIPPSGKESLTIKQRLSPTDLSLVLNCENEPLGAIYHFGELRIMIAAGTEFPHFERTPLMLPECVGSKDNELAQLRDQLTSLNRRSNIIIKLSLALGGAYTLEHLFEAGEPPSKERIEHWFNSTLRGHIHPDYLKALCEGMPELTDSPDEQKALISQYCSRLRRFIAQERRAEGYSDQKDGSTPNS